MSSKERKALAKRLENLVLTKTYKDDDYLVTVQECVLERPYSMVRLALVAAKTPSVKHIVYAFSKVCWPDEYDPDAGFELTVRKACARLARLILDGDR